MPRRLIAWNGVNLVKSDQGVARGGQQSRIRRGTLLMMGEEINESNGKSEGAGCKKKKRWRQLFLYSGEKDWLWLDE